MGSLCNKHTRHSTVVSRSRSGSTRIHLGYASGHTIYHDTLGHGVGIMGFFFDVHRVMKPRVYITVNSQVSTGHQLEVINQVVLASPQNLGN